MVMSVTGSIVFAMLNTTSRSVAYIELKSDADATTLKDWFDKKCVSVTFDSKHLLTI